MHADPHPGPPSKPRREDVVEVKGSGEEFQVGDENAAVLCGNIPTANATVYVVDTVLMPS